MPLKLNPTQSNLHLKSNHQDLDALAKFFRKTKIQIDAGITDTSQKQIQAFKETIALQVDASTNFYHHQSPDSQQSLLITYVRPFTDHITARYLLETKHFVRSNADIAGIKEHLDDLIKTNQVVVRVLPLSSHPVTQQLELDPYAQADIATIYETLAAVSDPTPYLAELFSIKIVKSHDAKPTNGYDYAQELPLLRQATINLTHDQNSLTHLTTDILNDIQRLTKKLSII